jgi:hypothetical protein
MGDPGRLAMPCATLGGMVGVTMMWEILCLLSEAVARRKGRL